MRCSKGSIPRKKFCSTFAQCHWLNKFVSLSDNVQGEGNPRPLLPRTIIRKHPCISREASPLHSTRHIFLFDSLSEKWSDLRHYWTAVEEVFSLLSGKNRRLSSIFDLCWRNEVSNFRLRKFEEVEPFCGPLGWRVDINTINSLDNSGSNETMQKVLASIV